MTKKLIASLCFLLPLFANAPRAQAETARAELIGTDGRKTGSATLTETPYGVLINFEASNLPPGPHAFHVHEVGQCEPPFQTAGGHLNPAGKKHGLLNPEGAHEGDLPNVYAAPDGTVKVEVLVSGVTLSPGPRSLFDGNGSSLVFHAAADDHRTEPAGNAGARIVCGVIAK